MSRRILITGGTGYLGGRLSEYLARQGHRVTAWGRREPTNGFSGWRDMLDDLWLGDIRETDGMDRLATGGFEAVVHLAAMDYRLVESSPEALFVDAEATWNLLQGCTRGGVGRFVLASSERVLGQVPLEAIDESFSPRPVNRLGLSKRLCEELVAYHLNQARLKGVSLRLSNVYGRPLFREGRVWDSVINQFCRMAFEDGQIRLNSDGRALRDFVHVNDFCRAVERLIAVPDPEPIYHLASGVTRSILEVAQLVQGRFHQRYKRELPVVIPGGQPTVIPGEIAGEPRYRLSIERLAGLGLEKNVTLVEGIDDLFAYLEESTSG